MLTQSESDDSNTHFRYSFKLVLVYKINFCFIKKSSISIRVQVNQRKRFPPNVFRFPLPARLQWVEPKAEDVWGKMYTLIYPDPINSMLIFGQFVTVKNGRIRISSFQWIQNIL